MLKRLFILVSFIFTSGLMAMDKIAVVTNDDNKKEVYELLIESADNGSMKFLHVTSNMDTPEVYTFEQVSKGITLVEQDGRQVVNLKGIDIDKLAGGIVEVNFLSNGISGKRTGSNLQIMSEDGKWVMKTTDNTLVKTIHFTVKKFLGKVIGLDEMLINHK